MRCSPLAFSLYPSSVLLASILAWSGASGQSVLSGGSCFKDIPDSACNHYTDSTPECPDMLLGGGQCGNPMPDPEGTGDEQQSINPSCLVVFRAPDANGNCITVDRETVIVSCLQTGGQSCQ